MAAHIDRARVADELPLGRVKRFGKRGVHDYRSRGSPDGNRHRHDGAGGRCPPGVHVQHVIDCAITAMVFVNGRTMLMLVAIRVVGNSVDMERERLGL